MLPLPSEPDPAEVSRVCFLAPKEFPSQIKGSLLEKVPDDLLTVITSYSPPWYTGPRRKPKMPSKPGQFWSKQAMVQSFQQTLTMTENEPIFAELDTGELRTKPIPLPDAFSWTNLDVDTPADVCYLFLTKSRISTFQTSQKQKILSCLRATFV